MPFFILLLAYVIRRRLDGVNRLDSDPLWRRCFSVGASTPPGRESRIWPGIVAVVLPALALVLVDHLLRASSWFLLSYLVDALVLIVLLGETGWKSRLTVYGEAWRRGDMQAAWHYVKDCLPADERGSAADPEALHLALSTRFMMAVFERYFLIIFWYVVGGVAVAFLVRGVLALRDHWPQPAARPGFGAATNVLAWLPARLLSLTFGLAGDLSGWLRDSRRRQLTPSALPQNVLFTAANSALTGYALDPLRFARVHPEDWPAFGGQSLSAIRDLLNRSMLVWICVLALLVIAGILA